MSNINYLLKCALYAESAYFENTRNIITKNMLMYIHSNIVEGYAFKEKDKLFIAFRGLDSIHDGINCINGLPTRLNDGMYVHSGYYNCYNSIKDYIIKIIQDQKDVKKIVFIGHSMGGSISILAAHDIKNYIKEEKKHIACVTFGCPAVGNKKFVQSFNNTIKSSYRITNGYDIIPHIPIYKHVNHQIKIGEKDNLVHYSYNINKRYVEPHKIDYYVKILKERSHKNAYHHNIFSNKKTIA